MVNDGDFNMAPHTVGADRRRTRAPLTLVVNTAARWPKFFRRSLFISDAVLSDVRLC